MLNCEKLKLLFLIFFFYFFDDIFHYFRIILQKFLGCFSSGSQFHRFEGIGISALLDHFKFYSGIQNVSTQREIPSLYMISNSVVLKGGATLFFTTLALVRFPTTSSPFLIWARSADFNSNRRIKFKRLSSGGRFRIAEHHSDLHPDLVDENNNRRWIWK